VGEEGKAFFFVKKKQKTFVALSRACWRRALFDARRLGSDTPSAFSKAAIVMSLAEKSTRPRQDKCFGT
jgi:hypothetical protein